ncbi:ribonuclease domain-containing protein [Mycobacterium sp. NPDC006124]|uniref:ribonuclease domain-containing protein n=1 Tax=Mycobacterium sp. NPDC006124 TaxID=3156729 RepID=UPI0033ABE566
MSARSRLVLVVACALIAVAAAVAWVFLPSTATTESTPAGMPVCPLSTLPREAAETVRAVHSAGPFPSPRNDGVVFGNREGHLPAQARGYYREYTVLTPGATNRSTRRIVTGGSPVTDPREYFYTADHYDSFCLVTGAGGRS